MNRYELSSVNVVSMNSSGGQLLKWKIGDTYIKTSTFYEEDFKTKFKFESYAEVMASRIGQKLGLDIVKYRLCEVIIDNNLRTIGCESKEFKPDGYSELTMAKLMLTNKIPKLIINDKDSYKKLIENVYQIFGINIRKYVDTMILFDSLILNTDRHFGNFGLMCGYGGKIKTIPLFDNGNSLFCDRFITELKYDKNLIQYLRFKPFSWNCNEQLKLIYKGNKFDVSILKDYIRGLLYEMVDNGLPKKRANFIKALLDDRITFIESM